jgi:SAM-dependent methyltransferase
MKPQDKQAYIRRYTERLRRYGHDPRSLGWGGGWQRQALRFKILSEIGIQADDSILDIGCGFCDLFGYLRGTGWQGVYLGIEIVSELLEVGRIKYPDVQTRVADILEEHLGQKFDWVVGSGLFNAKLVMEDNLSHITKMIGRMYEYAEKGVACDFMSTFVDYQHPDAFHMKPESAIEIAKSLTSKVIVRMDYLPYEFMLYMFRGSGRFFPRRIPKDNEKGG